jgi:hypothetical protein
MTTFLRSTRKALARATGLHHVASPERSQRKSTWVKPASPTGAPDDDAEEIVVRRDRTSPKSDARRPSGFSGVTRSVDGAKRGAWTIIKAATFRVRGVGYSRKNHHFTDLDQVLALKGPSSDAIYDVTHVDVVASSKKRLGLVKTSLRPPKPANPSPLHGLVPSILIVNAILPARPRGCDGACRQIILTCQLSERCCRELAMSAPQNGSGELNLKTAVANIQDPALRLWAAWCRDVRRLQNAADRDEVRGRFKFFAKAADEATAQKCAATLPHDAKSVVSGAALLCRNACAVSFVEGRGDITEVSIDGFRVPARVRAGLHALRGGLGNVDVAFGIEARIESELPERLLCCARLNRAVKAARRDEGWWGELLG